jgi:SHS2 domain-containing protein
MKNYELIEHTADVGVRVTAASLKELFQNAACAMFDIMAEEVNPGVKETKKIQIKQTAGDADELLVNWLNELLSLSATKSLIFSDFAIKKIDSNNLKAVVSGGDIKNYKVNTEIKAATYHELKLEQSNSGWKAEVIFDV